MECNHGQRLNIYQISCLFTFLNLFFNNDLLLQAMELLLTNVPLIGAKIFEKLDNPSIAQARLVNRDWADFIYNQVINFHDFLKCFEKFIFF